MEQEILEMLGVGVSPMYQKIAVWDSWWRGHCKSFHEYSEHTPGGGAVKRSLYRMNMAKKICEDWAALLLNDRCRFAVDDAAGEEFVKAAFAENDFLTRANQLVERAFAVGTGAVIVRIHGRADVKGKIIPDGCGVELEWIDGAHIIPLSVKNGEITEAAFVSEGMYRGEPYIYLESHRMEDDGYVIRNEFFGRENGKLVKKAGGPCEEVIRTHSPIPLFAVLTPNILNPVENNCGMGVSVFHDAEDCLRGVDLAFNNFCRDLKLGGKKVFISQSLVSRDAHGNVFTPDDVAQQLFVTLGDGDFSDNPMITEHNPDLRTAENAEAVQCQLNYLSFRCGLGCHHYAFSASDGRAKLTATQYMGERQDMRQNAVKHQKNVERFVRRVIRVLLWIGAEVYGLGIDRGAGVRVQFDDAYFADSDSERARDLAEVQAGVMTADEFRQKWIL
ncbi:MAG: hypothetical protein IJY35_14395 [Clostridia bacterium]|nr:hypothetical protein [Clostridia bacterium]